MFDAFPTYNRYRSLSYDERTTQQQGEDVYALQTALNAMSAFGLLATDGVLGPHTGKAIRDFQLNMKLVVDGKAGGITQQKLANELAVAARRRSMVAIGLLYGQIEHESSFRLGNYSEQRADGSYDAGVAQRNTAHTPPVVGFDTAASIKALAENARGYYDKFAGITDDRRRWGLAAGAWNAPAFACWIANEEGAHVPKAETLQPGTDSRATFENYVREVSAYIRSAV